MPKLVLAKGNYFGYAGKPAFLPRLIYPAPVDGGLGIHVTLDLAGRMRFGPDVEWLESENYDVDPHRAGFVLPVSAPSGLDCATDAGARLRWHSPKLTGLASRRPISSSKDRQRTACYGSCTLSESNRRVSPARCRSPKRSSQPWRISETNYPKADFAAAPPLAHYRSPAHVRDVVSASLVAPAPQMLRATALVLRTWRLSSTFSSESLRLRSPLMRA